MFALRPWCSAILAVSAITLVSPVLQAQEFASKVGTSTTELSRAASHGEGPGALPDSERAGNPILGIIFIVLLVGLLIFAAWIFSRIGSGNRPRADHTLD